ncbi:C-type lectin domain family 4 member M-like [Watersipora subatra]|uniref:C-type lectin domain family 4 member M-like n=1 Tax=Watersipora subatra TaxID=2589382 RepID=UPI00355B1CBC
MTICLANYEMCRAVAFDSKLGYCYMAKYLEENCTTHLQTYHTELTCTDPYTYNPIWETCFRLIETALSWDNADAYCRANGEYLATFATTEASEWLRAKFESDLSNSGWGGYNFIGRQKDLTEFEWKGLVTGVIPGNGQPNSDWYYNQPDNSGPENCLGIAPDGWHDISCSTPRPFICEYN